MDGDKDTLFSQNYACEDCGISMPELSPRMFSFNNPYGACPVCSGLGTQQVADPLLIIPDRSKSILQGAIQASGWNNVRDDSISRMYFEALAKKYHFSLNDPIESLPQQALDVILYGTGTEKLTIYYERANGRGTLERPFEGVVNNVARRLTETQSDAMRKELEECMSERPCPKCHGKRLSDISLAVTVGGMNIMDFCALPISEELKFIDSLKLTGSMAVIAEQIVREIRSRLSFLQAVGGEKVSVPVKGPYFEEVPAFYGMLPDGVAVIETARGTVRAELFGRETPVTVGNFIELAAKGFYDNLKFHAKKPGSVVLGGCPTTRTMGPAQVLAAAQGAIRGMHPGTGDARYTIIDEWEGNPRNRHVLGSLCMALVAGCRPQMELFAVLCLPIFWPQYIRQKRLRSKQGITEAIAFVLPVILIALGLMAYNAARFGSPFDFGANYNLTSNDMTHRGFRIGRLAPALFTYFLSLPVVRAVFPYLAGTKMQTNFMGMTITEVFYGGALVSLPLLWAFAALPLLRRRMARQKDLRAMVLLPVLLAVILAALDCQMAGVLYRYLSDYLTPLLFAAALVWLWAESALAPRVQAAASGSILHTVQHMLQGAMLAAVAVGICYSFCVYFAAEPGLLGQNPALYQNVSRLVQFWL